MAAALYVTTLTSVARAVAARYRPLHYFMTG